MTNKTLLAVVALGCGAAWGDVVSNANGAVAAELPQPQEDFFGFDAGADFRIRQEIMHNVPSMKNGMMGRGPSSPGYSKTKNMLRFRPRVWAELTMGDHWRLYGRLCDEFRAGLVQSTHAVTWPVEVVVDNLYLEGKGLFDDKIDVLVGRRDIYRLYGLDHIFVDGTTGDGSRTVYADMATLTWHVDEDSRLDVFGIFNKDREYMRLGTHRSYDGTQLTGFAGNDTEMDDWGWGSVWSSKVRDREGTNLLDYQILGIQKNTASFHRRGVKHPRRQVNLIGTKLVPHWTTNFSTPLEFYGQVGRNGENDSLSAWATYSALAWKDMSKDVSKGEWRPYWETGLLIFSGDKDAMNEDGGHHGWDPMWYRGIDDSEMMLYGATYGVGWWSNMYNLKTCFGIDFAPGHKIAFQTGPMFAQQKDHCGGGDGMFKGYLNQVRYDFPLWSGSKGSSLERFKIFGHVLFEHFLPGDYYDTDRPAYFVRWQVDFKF